MATRRNRAGAPAKGPAYPLTGIPREPLHATDAAGVREAVARARAAFPAWRDLGVSGRLRALHRLQSTLAANFDEWTTAISEDTGKPWMETLITELASLPTFLAYYQLTAARVLAPRRAFTALPLPGKKTWIEYFPMGVIAIIAPWNFPFQLSFVPALTALVAGNTVVLKPSEITPGVARVLEELFRQAELPEGVIEVVQGDGSTGAALCEAEVDKIFFTGSVQTGRKVMAAAATRPIPVELELGGKDAFIVCEDAPLERAARAAVWGGLMNAGQMCISVERVITVGTIHDRFVDALCAHFDALRVGSPDEEADVGPMTSEAQLEKVDAQVQRAIREGATLLRGGTRLDRLGLYYAPTLLTDVRPDMEIAQEETFGPVIAVLRARDEEEAVAITNDNAYGLTGSVWTTDLERGRRIASSVESGQVLINDVVLSVGHPSLPFGGVKASGFGRYHGPEGLRSFSHQKAVMADTSGRDRDPHWFPYAGNRDWARGLVRAAISRDPRHALDTAREIWKRLRD